MFLNLFLAEWKKVIGNRLLTSFTVWLFPIGLIVFLVFQIIAILVSDNAPQVFDLYSLQWTDAVNTWGLVTKFPWNILAHFPMLAFMAIYFAGEYEWHTWKNIVPRNRRATLLLTKITVLVSAIITSLFTVSLLNVVGRAIPVAMIGESYGPPLTSEVFWDFVGVYVFELALAILYLVILAGLAALSVMVTRSIVGGLIVSFIMSFAVAVSGLFLHVLASLFGNVEMVNLYRYTPVHAADNVRAWVLYDQAWVPSIPAGMTIAPDLGFSLTVLLVWAIGLVALNLYLFQRQDLME